MDLKEYQGKELFRRYGIPTSPQGRVARTPEEAERLAGEAAAPVMVKAQVLTGGRGKAGGVKYCADPAAARQAAEKILGLDIKGHVVREVLVEPASDIEEEFYLSVLHDRVSKGYKVIASAEGGVEIEEVNRTSPEKVVKADVDPTVGVDLDRAREILGRAGLAEGDLDEAGDLLVKLYDGFVQADATLFEVNPLIRTTDGRIIALDAKVSIDGNALFRHPDLAELDDDEAGGAGSGPGLERRAKQAGLQYVKLDGEVGVIGNGAGLVMATLDVVSQAGGRAANFLDVGGGADAEKMTAALSLVLSDPQVRSVLVNIFGGITRGDEVANGVLAALDRLGDVSQRLVVRLDGTNAEEGRRLLREADHPAVIPAEKMVEAAERAVQLAGSAR
jgi:succinyl-CoA synthetase beta subunit